MTDSVRTRIKTALAYQLGTISSDRNYTSDVARVFLRETSPERMEEFPAINIMVLRERTMNEVGNGADMAYQLRKQMSVILEVWLHEPEDMEGARDRIVQDVEKLIGANFTLPDENGQPTCQQAWVSFNEPFGYEADKPNGGVAIGIEILYRQGIASPTTYV